MLYAEKGVVWLVGVNYTNKVVFPGQGALTHSAHTVAPHSLSAPHLVLVRTWDRHLSVFWRWYDVINLSSRRTGRGLTDPIHLTLTRWLVSRRQVDMKSPWCLLTTPSTITFLDCVAVYAVPHWDPAQVYDNRKGSRVARGCELHK